jgi:hypothetical protein
LFTFPHPSPNETSVPADSPWVEFLGNFSNENLSFKNNFQGEILVISPCITYRPCLL